MEERMENEVLTPLTDKNPEELSSGFLVKTIIPRQVPRSPQRELR